VDLLKCGGRIVFLSGDIDRLAAKVHADPTRPLLDERTAAADLMRVRLPFYQLAADWTIDVEGRPREDIAQEIAARYR